MKFAPFDLLADLPTGTLLLEASAGTGKTFNIVGLTTRYLAEGRFTIDQLLLVTFTRLATSELRTKLYSRLLSGKQTIQDALTGSTTPISDPINAQLVDGTTGDLSDRLMRISAALNNIDQAVITTTDGFCSRMLSELGMGVDHDLHSQFEQDDAILTEQVIRDLLVRRGIRAPFSTALQLGQLGVAQADLPMITTQEDHSLQDFLEAVRSEFASRKRQRAEHGFPDLVRRLHSALTSESGQWAAGTLAHRFRLVLVDEFQDTDPKQWEILQRAFHQRSTLILIGDPKQAIYGFRGADVNAYLTARDVVEADGGRVATLTTNYRSEAPVVDGIRDIFGSANLGSEGAPILIQPVTAANHSSSVQFGDDDRRVFIHQLVTAQKLKVSEVRPLILSDLVSTVLTLLSETSCIDERRVSPSDIAVLTRSNSQSNDVQIALGNANIPSVVSGNQNIYRTQAATDWQSLLDAMAAPDFAQVARFSTTNLVGLSVAELAKISTEERLKLATQISELATLFETSSVAGVFELISAQNGLASRLLGSPGGERILTDLRHLAQKLQEVQTREGYSIQGLASWFREQRAHPSSEESRRLESDRAAVQVMTMHSAKGLEFPIVLLPFASDVHVQDASGDEALVSYQDRDRVLVLPPTTADSEFRRRAHAETLAEELRLFYVAATRAKSMLYLWWAPHRNTPHSPLQRLLVGQTGKDSVPASSTQVVEQLPKPVVERLGRTIKIDQLAVEQPGVWHPETPVRSESAARIFTRVIDHNWNRTSYSGLTSAAHESYVFDEPSEPPAETPRTQSEGTVSPMADLLGGTRFGTVVHAVYEACDPETPDLAAHLLEVCSEVLDKYPIDVRAETLSQALLPSLCTNLGELTDGLALSQLPTSNRLTELDFELPTGNAGLPNTVRDLANLFSDRSLLAAHDPLASYGAHLAGMPNSEQKLVGFLTGSIDAVYRVPASGQYVIFDYKTNVLPHGAKLRINDYHAKAMTSAMIDSHYPLQALLYSVALHRFLSNRLRDYSASTHLGGVGYLFVRGMSPDSTALATPMPAGVFTWNPSPKLILAASEVLAGEPR